MVINSTIQKSPTEAVHTFIYSERIDWTSISMPEVSNNSVQPSLLILQPSYITLTVVCWYACAQLCGPSFILLGLCHHKPQELIFSAGFVVKPLAAAALGVSSPPTPTHTIDRRSLQLQPGISKPRATSEGSCFPQSQALQRGRAEGQRCISQPKTHTALELFVLQLKCIKCKSPAGLLFELGDQGSGVLRCARNWNWA